MTQAVTFIKAGSISYAIPIGRGRSEAEAAQNDLARKANRGRLIKFRHIVPSGIGEPKCSFTTDNPVILRFLVKWNKENGHVLKADLSLTPLKCQQCDFETPDGSPESHQALALHVVEEHSDMNLNEDEVALEIDPDGKLVDPDNHKLADLKQIAIDAGGDEEKVAKITSKQGVVDYLQEIVPKQDGE